MGEPRARRKTTRRKAAPLPDIQEVQGELATADVALTQPIPPPLVPPMPPPERPLTGLRGALARVRMDGVAPEVDGFGLDPVFQHRAQPALDALYRRYWRVSLSGVENIPADGRAMLVANHAGGLPYDALMLMHGVRTLHRAQRLPRPLLEDAFWHLPFLGVFLARLGAVRAHPDNAERLLRDEQLLAVFPEGLKGMTKPYKDRYKLQRFGRGGFLKLALRTNTPVLPVAILGAEEVHPLLGRLDFPVPGGPLPFFPLTPTFPWLGVLGMVPLPTRWSIRIGAPLDIRTTPNVDLEDQGFINARTELVRSAIQRMLDDGLAARRSVMFG